MTPSNIEISFLAYQASKINFNAYLFFHSGARFSIKAFIPSLASS
jgi:hypothetical protein